MKRIASKDLIELLGIEFPVDTPVRVECAPSTATVFVQSGGGGENQYIGNWE